MSAVAIHRRPNKALGRFEMLAPLPVLRGLTVLVTGSGGFIGSRVCALLREHGAKALEFDLPEGDVLREDFLPSADWCIHLAGHKYATSAEDTPADVAELNITGTARMAEKYGSNLVLASTCKAADPMTVYGASKLIAERVALNAGARVVRFVNVLGSTGSLLELWDAVPRGEPIPVAIECLRMWMTPEEATHLIVGAIGWPSGRYALDVPEAEPVMELARRVLPIDAKCMAIPPRRGDRKRERLLAEYETASPHVPGVIRITHPADA